ASPTVRISATGTPSAKRFHDMATTKAMKLCRPSPLGPRKRAPATEMASVQICGVRFEAAFQIPPRVTEIPVVAAAAVETGGAVVLASTSGAERPHDVVGARIEPKRRLELTDGRRFCPARRYASPSSKRRETCRGSFLTAARSGRMFAGGFASPACAS